MRPKLTWLALVLVIAAIAAVVWQRGLLAVPGEKAASAAVAPKPIPPGNELATLGAGCFWCTEAIFQRLKGVHSVVSGYSGGDVKDPTYEQICSATTGHAEVIQVTYDPAVVSFADLLEVFWQTHDPTTRDRQGADRGPQYRSAIFYHTEGQRALAEELKRKLDASGAFAAPLVTEITPFSAFYPAEAYHQNFFEDNPRQRYCAVVIQPKLDKFEKVFKDKLRPASPR
jgi:peptide-methionine (S)-S-oxide reductase